MINCRQTSSLMLLIALMLRPLCSQSRKSASDRAQSGLQVRVDLAPVVQTTSPKEQNSQAQGITYDLQPPPKQVESFQETVTMTTETGERIPVRRTTIVMK
jgi:hypothetical protein